VQVFHQRLGGEQWVGMPALAEGSYRFATSSNG
jgi:hypothetical protein